MSLTTKTLKEALETCPETMNVRFYIDGVAHTIESHLYNIFNNELFLLGYKDAGKEYSKEQVLEQLQKLQEFVKNSDKETYII